MIDKERKVEDIDRKSIVDGARFLRRLRGLIFRVLCYESRFLEELFYSFYRIMICNGVCNLFIFFYKYKIFRIINGSIKRWFLKIVDLY